MAQSRRRLGLFLLRFVAFWQFLAPGLAGKWISSGIGSDHLSLHVDLEPYTNTSAFAVNEMFSLRSCRCPPTTPQLVCSHTPCLIGCRLTYSLFRSMALRHL